jgi:hypothetical protein
MMVMIRKRIVREDPEEDGNMKGAVEKHRILEMLKVILGPT